MTYPWSSGEVLTAADLNASIGNSWSTPTFSAGWANFGSGLPDVRYRVSGDTLNVHGLAKRTGGSTSGGSSVIFVLPSGSRPASGYTISATWGSSSTVNAVQRVNVFSNGEVALDSATPVTTGDFVWLNLWIPMS
jgi:hypothetical protein